jgi:hypothetical protein
LGVTREPADDATDGEQGNGAENEPSRDTAARIEDLKAIETIETIVRFIGSADLDDVYAPVTFGRRHKKSMNSRSRPGNRWVEVRP